MGERKSRNLWLRMTDQTGLSEPEGKAQLPSPGMHLLATVLWAVSAVIWLSLAFQAQGEIQILYAILIVLSLGLAVNSFVMLRGPRNAGAGPTRI